MSTVTGGGGGGGEMVVEWGEEQKQLSIRRDERLVVESRRRPFSDFSVSSSHLILMLMLVCSLHLVLIKPLRHFKSHFFHCCITIDCRLHTLQIF